jgi:hypothetical protein
VRRLALGSASAELHGAAAFQAPISPGRGAIGGAMDRRSPK